MPVFGSCLLAVLVILPSSWAQASCVYKYLTLVLRALHLSSSLSNSTKAEPLWYPFLFLKMCTIFALTCFKCLHKITSFVFFGRPHNFADIFHLSLSRSLPLSPTVIRVRASLFCGSAQVFWS